MPDDVKQFNVYLSRALIREIKYMAIEREQSLSSLVEEGMRRYLAELRRRPNQRSNPK